MMALNLRSPQKYSFVFGDVIGTFISFLGELQPRCVSELDF
jgi:hypothetical protein